MIISRTPFRMSFVGGGSDLPNFYRKHRGAVISTAINKYVYVNVNKKFDQGIRIAYSKTEEVAKVELIEHQLVRSAMQMLQLPGGIEITTIADIPSKGTGLGSSSSFTVGLLNALHAYQGSFSSSEMLAQQACHVEINLCQEPIGKQDQYAAAYGGFNLIEFHSDDSVSVTPVVCSAENLQKLQSSLLMFYTGITRSASDILSEQSSNLANDQDKSRQMLKMVELTHPFAKFLSQGDLPGLGAILRESWEIKKSMATGVSTQQIDLWYDLAIKAGALGGKLLGAGAGGFLIFIVPEDSRLKVINALSNLRQVDVEFDRFGSRVIFSN